MDLLGTIIWSALGFLGLWELFYLIMKYWNFRNEKNERIMVLPVRERSENLELLLREVMLKEGVDFPILLADFGAGEEIRQTAFLLQQDFPNVCWISREMLCSELEKNLCLQSGGKYIIINKISEKQREERHGTEGIEHTTGKCR